MRLESLLLCADTEVLHLLQRVLHDFMQLRVCTRAEHAAELLQSNKFDAVIVDCQLEGAAPVLHGMRNTPSNRRALAFAILDNRTNMRTAFDLGADFVLERPLSFDRVARSFRAAHSLMLQERRRYFRHSVQITAWLEFKEKEASELQVTVTNLSETGMAVRYKGVLPNDTPRARFTLPGTNTELDAKTEVVWRDGDNRAGLRFRWMSNAANAELVKWIAGRSGTEESLHEFLNSPAGEPLPKN